MSSSKRSHLGLGFGLTKLKGFGGAGLAYTPPAPTVLVQPTISGDNTAGQPLTCNTGLWSGQAPFTYGFQWTLDGANISLATLQSYTSQNTDATHQVDCKLRITDANGRFTDVVVTGFVIAAAGGASTDYPPFLAYDSANHSGATPGFLTASGTTYNIVTEFDIPAGSSVALFHTCGTGAFLTGVSDSTTGTWTLGIKQSYGLDSRSAVKQFTQALPAGSNIGITQQATGGASIMVIVWKGGLAIDQSAPTPYPSATTGASGSWSTSIADSNLPCYVAALIGVNAGVGSIGSSTGWTSMETHGTTFGAKLLARRIEAGQSPVTIGSGDTTGSGQGMIFVTFTAPAAGGGGSSQLVSNSSALMSAFANCTGGETLLLQDGVTFANVSLTGKTFSSRVTIKSNNTNSKAKLQDFSMSGVSGVNITDVNVGSTIRTFGDPPQTGYGTGIAISTTCSNITLTSVNFDNTCGVGLGCGGSNVLVQDCDLNGVGRGFQLDSSNGCTLRRVKVHGGWYEDAVHGSGVTNLLVEYCFFTESIPTDGGTHPDAFQITQDGSAPTSSTGITLRYNLYYVGTVGSNGKAAQFCLIDDQTSNNVDVHDNLAIGVGNIGIQLGLVTNGNIANNKIYPLSRLINPNTGTPYGAEIKYSNDTTISITNNVSSALYSVGVASTGVTLSGNSTTASDPGDDGAALMATFRALYPSIPT
jgi:hypothetical protein